MRSRAGAAQSGTRGEWHRPAPVNAARRASRGEDGGSNLFGREGMEGLVLLAGRRCHGLRHGKGGAEVGGKPQRFGLTLTLIALVHAQPDRHTRTPAGGYAGTHTSTTAPISATPAPFSLGLHLGCVCRL